MSTTRDIAAALRRVSQLRRLCLSLPHIPTPAEERLLSRFDEISAHPASARKTDVDAIAAGWREWWRTRQVAVIARMARAIDHRLVDGDRRLATLAVAAWSTLEASAAGIERRDYSIAEWGSLSERSKLELMDQYWDPRRPKRGERTREAIVEAFAGRHPHLVEQSEMSTGYFSNWGWCLVVMVADTSVRVPTSFDVFPVVKGRLVVDESGGATVEWLERPPS